MSTSISQLDYVLGNQHICIKDLSRPDRHKIIEAIQEVLDGFLHLFPVFKPLDQDEMALVSPEYREAKFFRSKRQQPRGNMQGGVSFFVVRNDGCIFEANTSHKDGELASFRLDPVAHWHDEDVFTRTLSLLWDLTSANNQTISQWASTASRLEDYIGTIQSRLGWN